MPDGGFKGMTPDPDSNRRPRGDRGPAVPCDRCGGQYYMGDWWLCKGRPEDHER